DGALKTRDGGVAYCASKVFAERAVWDFVSEHTESKSLHPAKFILTTICPPMVYGPLFYGLAATAGLSTSIMDIYRFINGSEKRPPTNAFWGFVDARDVDTAHVAALMKKGKEVGVEDRFLVAGGTYSYNQVCKIIEKHFLHLVKEGRTPKPNTSDDPYHYNVDNSKSKRELGMTFRTLEQCIVDTVRNFLDMEE
ncbi:NAD(P)-binding protein, partial [Choiromyces venosus 120613-1]